MKTSVVRGGAVAFGVLLLATSILGGPLLGLSEVGMWATRTVGIAAVTWVILDHIRARPAVAPHGDDSEPPDRAGGSSAVWRMVAISCVLVFGIAAVLTRGAWSGVFWGVVVVAAVSQLVLILRARRARRARQQPGRATAALETARRLEGEER